MHLGFLLLLAALLSGCSTAAKSGSPSSDADTDDRKIVHLLNRAAFGPTIADIAKVREMGIDAYLEQQLKPGSLSDSDMLEERLAQLPTLKTSVEQLSADYELPAGSKKSMSEEGRKEVNRHKNQILKELMQAKVLRAVASPAQLQEVMTDFWFNHFNVFAEKGADRIWIGAYERDAIRPYALGKFRDLLRATAHHPAMLFYLDNWLNTAPNSPGGMNRKAGINENYARELMELHTLGVDGGYSQQDVTALAHILTGWGLSQGKELWQRSEFDFNPRRHDFSDQTLLGRRVRGAGQAEIEAVIDMLASHPSTAHHIAFRLAQAFVADNPPEALVNKLATVFTHSGGDITELLRALFRSPEFWDGQYTQNKFKPPFRYAVSVLRAGQIFPPGDTKSIQGALNNMGQPLYRCLTPNGYANTTDQWLNPDALLKRIEFAKGLNRFGGGKNLEVTIQAGLSGIWTQDTLLTVQDAPQNQKPVLLLSSPEFLYY